MEIIIISQNVVLVVKQLDKEQLHILLTFVRHLTKPKP